MNYNFLKTLYDGYSDKTIKRCLSSCEPGSIDDVLSGGDTGYFFGNTIITCCQSSNCNGNESFLRISYL